MTSINFDPKNNLSVNSFVPTKPSDGLIHDMAKRGLIKTLSSSKAGTNTTDTVELGPEAKLENLIKEKFNGMTLEELRDAYKATPSADLCKISPLLDEFLNEDTSEARKSELLGQIEERMNGSDQASTTPGIPAFTMPNIGMPSFPAGGLGGIPNFPQIPQSSYTPPEAKGDSDVKLDGTNEQRAKTAEKTADEVKQEKETRQTEVGKQLEENEKKILDTRKQGRTALIEKEYGKAGDKEGKIPAMQAEQYQKTIKELGDKKDDDSQKPNSSTKIGKVQADIVTTKKDAEKLMADKSQLIAKAKESNDASDWDAVTKIDNQIHEKDAKVIELEKEKSKLVKERDKKIEDIKTAKGETEEGKAVKAVIDEKIEALVKAEDESEDKTNLAALAEGGDGYGGLDELSYNGEKKEFAEIRPLLDDYKKLAVEKKALEDGKTDHKSDVDHAEATAKAIKERADQKATPKETENLPVESRKPKEETASSGSGGSNPLGGLTNLINTVAPIASALISMNPNNNPYNNMSMPMMGMPSMSALNMQGTLNPNLAPIMAQMSDRASHLTDGLPFATQQGAGNNLSTARQTIFGTGTG